MPDDNDLCSDCCENLKHNKNHILWGLCWRYFIESTDNAKKFTEAVLDPS
jgi:hypothetical protein